MSIANRRVLADLHRWADAYRRGDVRPSAGRTLLSPGERLAVSVFPVRLSQEPADRPFAEWDPRPGSRSLRLPFRNDGTMYATSERLYLVRRPHRGVVDVQHEWAWDDVLSCSVVANWRGVMVRTSDDVEQLHVVANVFHTFLVRPSVISMAVTWLKVEATWADARGQLDGWLLALPQRLGRPKSAG